MPIDDCFSSFEWISTLGHVTAATKPYLFACDQLISSSLKIKCIRNSTVENNTGNDTKARHQKVNRVKLKLISACRNQNGLVCGNMKSECHLNLISTQRFSPREACWFPDLLCPTCVFECVSVCGYNQLTLSVVKEYFIFIVVLFSFQKKWQTKDINKGHWRILTSSYCIPSSNERDGQGNRLITLPGNIFLFLTTLVPLL